MEPPAAEEPVCARCQQRPARGEELKPCIGCGHLLCGRPACSRDGYENLARRVVGRTCGTCIRKREIVPRAGAGKGAGSAAGVEAVERGRYYIHEATEELERRLRQLSVELAERISTVVEARLDGVGERAGAKASSVVQELEAATARQIDVAAERLGRALEEALARGLARGAGAGEKSGQALIGGLGQALRAARGPLLLLALVVLVANAAVTVAIVLALGR